MTYGDFKKRVLQQIFSYSLAETEIPATYNNQADYIMMMPGLVNAAQFEIATTVRRIPETVMLSSITPATFGAFDKYALPTDCWQIMQGGLMDIDTGGRFHDFKVALDGSLLFRSGTDVSRLALEYWRYPNILPYSLADSVDLDNTKEVQEAIVYYVAAGLIEYDDGYRAEVFRNEYEKKKALLREPLWLEPQPILNRYMGE